VCRQSILGRVKNAVNVDRLAIDCEQDAVDMTTAAEQLAAQVDAQIRCLIRFGPLVRVCGEGVDNRFDLLTPANGCSQ